MAAPHVENHLLREIARWHSGAQVAMGGPHGYFPAGWDLGARFQAQLDALVAVGLLDGGEAEAWRAEWDDAEEPPARPGLDPDLADRARRYVESLVAHEEDPGRVVAAVTALERVGAFDEDEADGWIDRVSGWEDDEPGGADLVEVAEDDLRHVALGPIEEVDGFRVVCVELYPRGAVVRWTRRTDKAAQFVAGDRDWRGMSVVWGDDAEFGLADDVGTAYDDRGGGGGSGGFGPERWTTSFVPAVPDAARRLFVVRGDHRIEIELSR